MGGGTSDGRLGDKPGRNTVCLGQSGAGMWRVKLGTFCRTLNLNSDNYMQFLGEWFGRNWVYHLRPLINSIKVPEYYPANESSESIRAVWLVVQNERVIGIDA